MLELFLPACMICHKYQLYAAGASICVVILSSEGFHF